MKRKEAKRQRGKGLLCLLIVLLVSGWQPTEPLIAGTYQAEDVARELPESADTVETGNAQNSMALQTTYARFVVAGNRVEMRWRGEGEITPFEKTTVVTELTPDNQWRRVSIQASRFQDEPFSFAIRANGDPILIDTLIVQSYSTVQFPGWLRGCIIPLLGLGLLALRYAGNLGRSGKQNAS